MITQRFFSRGQVHPTPVFILIRQVYLLGPMSIHFIFFTDFDPKYRLQVPPQQISLKNCLEHRVEIINQQRNRITHPA